MALNFQKKSVEHSELDVTSFMNLMIVLVPVMLMSMTFTQITVHEIKLPDLSNSIYTSDEKPPKLEVVVAKDGIKVFYPSNRMVQDIPLVQINDQVDYDFEKLSLVLQEVKLQLKDKKDLLLFSASDVDYQTLVSTMDAIKSYKTLVAASVVEIELFPEIALADASIR